MLKLDSRITDSSKIFNRLNVDEANIYIGTPGFFANSLVAFANLKLTNFGVLAGVEDGFELQHEYTKNETFEFFIPKLYVKFEPNVDNLREDLDSINERLRDIETDFPDICETVREHEDSIHDIYERLRFLENIYRKSTD